MKGELINMLPRDEWIQILIHCRNKVQKNTKPLLGEMRKPQPNLGMGAGGDPVKKIDLAAEKAIMDTLEKYASSFTLISEESGLIEHGREPGQCYVTADPVDGTTNLTRGIPFYATSIAVSSEPSLETVHTALVTDLFHGTTYTAQRGAGAFRDDERITSSTNFSVEEGVIGIDLNSYRIQKLASKLTALMSEAKHLRHFGANALELCYVADGTTDAFIDIREKLRTTDVAAASLIIGEAGAKMTTPEGKQLKVRLDPKQTMAFVASGNANIHKRILDLIATQREKE
jgi:myo-inositol-1(or 4)-monophosphatase